MRVLLVVPPEENYTEASANISVDKKREPRPKLGILYVGTYLKSCQPDVELKVIDCPSDNLNFIDYKTIVHEFKPDLVGITALTFTIVDALKAARLTKEVNPKTLVCIGGFHCTLFPRETLNQSGVDFIVIGEGELTFNELVYELKKINPLFEDIKGLGFHCGLEVVINTPRPLIEDFDSLPFPDYHLVNISKYTHILGKGRITIALQSSRGCSFGCIFCDIRRTKFRFRSAQSVVEEIAHWYKEGVSSFFFVDDNFVIRRDRLLDICNKIIERKMEIDFKISSRVDTVDEEMLIALKKAGCSRINFGVESSHQKYLDYLEKGITQAQAAKVFKLCHDIGIETFAYIILGIPNETQKEMYEELKFLKKIKADYASFSVCSPYPKTLLYKRLLDNKVITYDYWQAFAENPMPGFIMPLLPGSSPDELRHIQADITRRFYLSVRFIFKKIISLRSCRQFLNISKLGWRIVYTSITK